MKSTINILLLCFLSFVSTNNYAQIILKGDMNGDGEINGSDITTLAADILADKQENISLLSIAMRTGDNIQLACFMTTEDENVIWTSSDESIATVSPSGQVHAIALGSCMIVCTAADNSWQSICPVSVISDRSGTIDGHNYVDLGLPSGTLWADTNVGADSPEEYGNYYAWGETATKSSYSWTTYKYYGGSVLLRKYCTDSNYGNVDNLRVLEADDDAACVNWSTAWCMPDKAQLEELMDTTYTETEWTTLNGVKGCKVISKANGNSIFLPAAGTRDDSSLYNAGKGGYYWTRNLNIDKPGAAYYRYFYGEDENATTDNGRYAGRSVRAVRAKGS